MGRSLSNKQNKSKGSKLSKSNAKIQQRKSKSKKKDIDSNDKDEGKERDENKLMEKAQLLNKSSDEQVEMLKDFHNRIILQPQQNFKHLESMFTLTKISNLKIVCMALRVLAETFINIAPLQAIDVKKLEERTEIKIKKQEYKVVKFQKNLIMQYERYIKILKQMNSKAKPTNFNNDQQIYKQFKKCVLQCSIKLFRTLWNFNFSKQLNALTLKFIKYEQCLQFYKEMLMQKNVAMIGIKSKIISGIAKIIKDEENEKRLPSNLIQIINCTYIDSQYLQKDQDTFKYKKKQLKKKLYKQEALETKKQKQKMKHAEKGSLEMKRKKKQEKLREKMKVREEVNKQFSEGDAIIKNKDLVRHNSSILQQLFYIYFKILVERINSIFFKDCLDGILKFVHLINVELTQSLIDHINASAGVFREYFKADPTPQLLEMRLNIVFTGQSIINGPLSIFNMDDSKMTTHLYKIMKDINKTQPKTKSTKITYNVYRMICLCMNQTFIKRRQLSQEIVGSFVRELGIFLQRKQLPKLYTVQLIRTLAYRYSKICRMFESDNQGFGMNSFNQSCEDPQCSNAINTEIVTYLKSAMHRLQNFPKSYQQSICSKIQKLLKQNFTQKDMSLTLDDILEEELQGGFFQIGGSF